MTTKGDVQERDRDVTCAAVTAFSSDSSNEITNYIVAEDP
jgi:hypothetical protein